MAISFFIKRDRLKRGIFHADLWGKQLEKHNRLARENFEDIKWKPLEPVKPSYFFIPHDMKMWKDYEKGWPIQEIFIQNSIGIVTTRDNLTVHMSKDELMETVREFASLDAERAREKYQLRDDVRD